MSIEVKPTTDAILLDHIISRAFKNLPYQQYIIRYNKRVPENVVLDDSFFEKNFLNRIKEHIAAGAEIIEAGNNNAVAIWYSPHAKFPEPVPELGEPETNEFDSQSHLLKEKYLKGQKHYYLNIVARNLDQKPKSGAVSALIRPYLERADKEGFPVLLEAVDEHAREVYEHLGFKVFEVFSVGVGKVDLNNVKTPNGSGIPLYFMLYNYQK